MWATLLPLLLLLRPYEGLIQDARIYIGRGVADRDPAGLGQDILFAADGQTGFTALKPLIRALLGVLTATQVSMAVALVGSLLWVWAVVALCRSLARGRAAWAAAVCVLALPADYGAFGSFVYGEAVVTPRVFAETAVLGAMAGLVGGRRLVPLALLAAAMALHPLMALPGLAVAAAMLAWEDRRWLLPIGCALAALVGAVALKLPLADRLLVPMDATWLAILKERSVNVFPSLWDADVFARIAGRLAAVVVAGTFAPPRVRALLWAVAGVAVVGLGLAAIFGDWFPLVLATQLQLWRALWPLAVLGNACVALAAVGLWRGGAGARLALAVLSLAWLSVQTPPLSIALAMMAVGLRFADLRGSLPMLSPRVAAVAIAAAAAVAALTTIVSGFGLAAYVKAAGEQSGETVYSQMLAPGVQIWPLVVGALAIALRQSADASAKPWPGGQRAAAALGLVAATLAGAFAWNSGTSEYRLVDHRDEAAVELRRLLGPTRGPVLWIDDYSEAWFLADRPSFFSSVQGCPILFSRALALEWHDRGEALVALGLARARDLAPWTGLGHRAEDLAVSPTSVEAFCRDPRHPAAIVAPGAQLGAAPPGYTARLWRPPVTVQFVSGDDAGLHWRKADTFTIIRCRPGLPPTAG